MEKRDARHKGETYHKLRTKLALVRFQLSQPIYDGDRLATLKSQESALIRQMQWVEMNGGKDVG